MIKTCIKLSTFALILVFGSSATLADITGTNILGLASYSNGTNASLNYSPPQVHQITQQSFNLYHSTTNASWPTTNILETSFDGGNTWTVTAVYVASTNFQNETWRPSLLSITATNRVRVITTTNQTLSITPNWNQ